MVLETLNPTGANALLGFILAVSWIFVVLRLYVRVFMVRNVSWDDYLIVASTLCYTAFVVFALGLIRNGLGTDVDDEDFAIDEFSRGSFYFMFSELTFILCSTILRLACAVMLWRVVLRKDVVIRYVILITAAVMLVYSTAFFFTTLFQCRPVHVFWTHMYHTDKKPQCIAGATMTSERGGYVILTALFISHSVISLICDWVLGILPFFILRHLQMTWKKKAIIISLMSLGILVGVAALVRVPLLIYANKVEFWDEAIPVAITAAIEPFLGTVALCSAAILPLFKKAALRRIDSDDVDASHAGGSGGSGGSHAMTSRARGRHKDNSKTAIVVETSWVVEDDVNDRKSDNQPPANEVVAMAV